MFGVNLLEGKGGNDRLFGEGGDDTYSFGRGDGSDQIFETADIKYRDFADVISFKEGVQSQDLEYLRFGDELQISIKGTGDKQLSPVSYLMARSSHSTTLLLH
jgi:Ca2+-binding RTX toxin-like protein